MSHLPLLSILIWLPILGAIPVLMLRERPESARWLALMVSVAILLLCIPLWVMFDTSTYKMQFVEFVRWIPVLNINYALGVDGISMPMIVLTSFTTVIVCLASWTMVHKRVAEYLAMFLVMQGTVIGVFAALDSMLFYFFWEAMLIPMYLSIGIWGGENRSYAAIKFFLYTFLGSALLLVALLYLRMHSGTFNILGFYNLKITASVQHMIFWAFLLAFATNVLAASNVT